jgi:hypothetical protein
MAKNEFEEVYKCLVKLGCGEYKNGHFKETRPITLIDILSVMEAGIPLTAEDLWLLET